MNNNDEFMTGTRITFIRACVIIFFFVVLYIIMSENNTFNTETIILLIGIGTILVISFWLFAEKQRKDVIKNNNQHFKTSKKKYVQDLESENELEYQISSNKNRGIFIIAAVCTIISLFILIFKECLK